MSNTDSLSTATPASSSGSAVATQFSPPPRSQDDQLSRKGEEDAQVTEVVARYLLGFTDQQQLERFSKDCDCAAAATIFRDAVVLQAELGQFSFCHVDTREGKALKEQVQALQREWMEYSGEFCQAFYTLQSFFKDCAKNAADALEFQDLISDDPLNWDDMSESANVEKVKEALDVLEKDIRPLKEKAAELLIRAQEGNQQSKECEFLLQEYKTKCEELSKAQKEENAASRKCAEKRGKVAEAKQEATNIAQDAAGLEAVKQKYEREEAQAASDIRRYKQREEDTTFRKFNQYTSMWENDVLLAGKNVARSTAEKKELANRTEALKTGRDEGVKQHRAEQTENVKHLTQVTGKLAILEKDQKAAAEAVHNAKKALADVKGKIEAAVKNNGVINTEHLLWRQVTVCQAALRVRNGSNTVAAFKQALTDPARKAIKALEQVAKKGECIEKQKKLLAALQQRGVLNFADKPLMTMITESPRPLNFSLPWQEVNYVGISQAQLTGGPEEPLLPTIVD
mmetsp:Transcript_26148/g.56715  ORF Transcript_26148/g.56715 Transcript_26148/m.56715 type:complete len:513 (-) Transcript_26148:228-1766(-)|eukprot:CAMPEP_0206446808 /NCGR_PEP_ID=MMETSP0324_2-20121206/16373_1 /ASSEMBLY_ACC=CAM_ASM_000836 /TAXON_ID=2866 /ORGANISM="Crypthecodinium cohnii, Strain Seligo" /LENGTH=512 /DNA_ID=CAMNT_0053915383 /DNA_START=87 /DNA_END=1625 /DNA_ORIENTATION=-